MQDLQASAVVLEVRKPGGRLLDVEAELAVALLHEVTHDDALNMSMCSNHLGSTSGKVLNFKLLYSRYHISYLLYIIQTFQKNRTRKPK